VSVLVPARNEEAAVGRLCADVLASTGVDLELVILDDSSTDRTAAIVAAVAARDARVRLVSGPPLPPGWCGKQHACWQLAQAARHDTWVFLDVDVAPAPDAIARAVAFLDASGAGLVSGFPRQQTSCLLDWLLLPLIHFILLGFLPLARSRTVTTPSLAAGCGQFFVTRRRDYEAAGGHAAIRASLHDGVKLPRAYRRAGLATDVFDAVPLASCRMYDRDADVWRGLAKNATEGVGAPATIVPFTILLAGGQILPFGLGAAGLAGGFLGWPRWGVAATLAAVALAWLPRLLEAVRFRQSVSSAIAHPLAVAVFLAIQWTALVRKALGCSTSWRGRSLTPQ
jgi:glycosyltransferase involved in cell wall biosynthesis